MSKLFLFKIDADSYEVSFDVNKRPLIHINREEYESNDSLKERAIKAFDDYVKNELVNPQHAEVIKSIDI